VKYRTEVEDGALRDAGVCFRHLCFSACACAGSRLHNGSRVALEHGFVMEFVRSRLDSESTILSTTDEEEETLDTASFAALKGIHVIESNEKTSAGASSSVDAAFTKSRGAGATFQNRDTEAEDKASRILESTVVIHSSDSGTTLASGYSESARDLSEVENGANMATSSFSAKLGMTFESRSDSATMKALSRGIRTFNLNPKRGIAFIRSRGLVQSIPDDPQGNARRIAAFLAGTRGLNKEQLGKYLSGDGHEQKEVLKQYFQLFDFSQHGPTIKGLEQALRSSFECFRPPGEAQKIERIIEALADKFNEDNALPMDERNPDAAFHASTTMVLAYAIIMLNVDLHNPNNPHRMERRQFIRNFRGLDQGEDLDPNELGDLFDCIARSQIKHKIDRDEVAGDLFTYPDKCGWLYKKGAKKFSSWKPRWFILSENTLWYFKHSEDVEPQGFIPLENLLIQTCDDAEGSPLPFRMSGVSAALSDFSVDEESDNIAETKPKRKSLRHVSLGSAAGSSKSLFGTHSRSNSASDLPANAKNDAEKAARVSSNMSMGKRAASAKKLHHTKSEHSLTASMRLRPRSTRVQKARNFWFELRPWDERLNVKSARLSKKKGSFVLGQHRTIKLRADSRQEMDQWVEILNQKGRFDHSMQEITSRVLEGTDVTKQRRLSFFRSVLLSGSTNATSACSDSLILPSPDSQSPASTRLSSKAPSGATTEEVVIEQALNKAAEQTQTPDE